MSGPGTSWPSAAWRWLLFTGLALALGGLLGARLSDTARAARPTLPALRRWEAAGALLGLAGTLGLAARLVADAGAGALGSATSGRVTIVEAGAFTVCLLLLALRRPGAAWLPLLAVPVAEGVRGHVEQAAAGWGALLTGVHLAAVAVWVGALVHVVRVGVAWRTQRAAVWWVLTGYARWAAWLFVAVIATGTASALVLVPASALTSTAYGRWPLVKLALVAVAAGAALTARWWLRHGPDRQVRADRQVRVARATRVEAGALTAVLAVTGVLVSTPSARDSQQPLAPPPPAGVVVPLGTLAGQVGVAVAASDGQLVVRLSTPRLGDYYTPDKGASYTLAGQLAAAGHTGRAVRWRGCGPGCFSAPAAWAGGDNLLTLRAGASGWRGGTVSLVVPWPVTAAVPRLARAVAATRAAGQVTVYEAVTSDTSTPMPDPTPLPMTGAAFVATEPYSSGVAPQVVLLRRDAATQRLAVGFPAEGRYVELVLDARDRIVEEVQVDAKHLTRRRFVYADQASD